MGANTFTDVDSWVFDLDNTLYHPSARLFDQIEVRMTRYVQRTLKVDRTRADQIRQDYYHRFGTTLAGLMHHHDIDPHPYLNEVHDIDVAHLQPDPDLAQALETLPGRRVVHTNGSARHAERVLEQRGLTHVFDAIYGVEHADFHPKPSRAAYDTILDRDQMAPEHTAMFEDDHRNLAVPHDLGMRTILVGETTVKADHVHHQTTDLERFIRRLTDQGLT